MEENEMAHSPGVGKGGALLKALELSAMSRPGQYKTGDAVPTIPGLVQTGTVIKRGKRLRLYRAFGGLTSTPGSEGVNSL